MNTLPSSIESSLLDAGFAGTEILILNKLLDADAMTLRELASKTGKSTGVLDQAMKKLLKKGIVVRENINDTPKYLLHSLESVQNWMKNDTQQKQQMIIRKYENFEAFIQSMVKGKARPEMQFFEGIEGMKRAYMQLLERGKIFLRYGPPLPAPDDDSLRDFRAQYVQECRHHSIFTRVITHNTPLGRRQQSRDAFEYRQTILVDPKEEPFLFEKIIVGDTLACFHMQAEQACLIRYNDLAEQERSFFELLWLRQQVADKGREEAEKMKEIQPSLPPPQTRVFSVLQQFFGSRRGIIGLGTCAAVAGVLTGLFFWQMANANLERIREQVKAVAATGALQFDVKDLDQLRTKEDMEKPEYAKVLQQMVAIRNQNTEVKYLYILRETAEKDMFEFVADADSISLDRVFDINGDGRIDQADENIAPGRKYPATGDVLTQRLYDKPVASAEPYTDQWGTFISGFAPIRDKDGNIKAIIGADKWAKDIYKDHSIGNILAFFFFLFSTSIVIWLMAFDNAVFREIQKHMKTQGTVSAQLLEFFFTKKSLLITAGLAVLSGLITFGLYQNNAGLNLKRVQEKVLSVVATGALQFDAKELDQLHTVADIGKPEYAKVIYLLNAIRQQNDGIKYAYIMRPTAQDGIWEFVADADSLDPYAKKDLNGDGVVNDEDHLSPPGELYNAQLFAGVSYADALQKPSIYGPSKDQWGDIISGWAPIKNASGSTVAIFGIDKFTSDVGELTAETIMPVYYFLCLFLLFLFIRLAAFNRSLFKEICELVKVRKFVIIVGSAAVVSMMITFGLYQYTQRLTLRRMQDKVMAIAITASAQFEARDINELQKKEDWQKPEWIKLSNQLGKIKKENGDVIFAYIFRKSKTDPTKMEFVVDADSLNPNANTDNDPTNDVDMNHDGKIDGSPTGEDYLQWPSQPYPTAPPETFDAYNGPTVTHKFYEDQWGKFISGYAPIKHENGTVAGIIAIDMGPGSQNDLTSEVFTPMYVFILFFALFVLFMTKGFSKSLLHQLLRPFRKRLTILIIVFSLTAVGGIIFGVYKYTLYIMTQEIGTRLMSIAATAAPEFNLDDLNQIHIAADMKKEAYQRVFKKLNEIRKHNQDIQWAYIHRSTKEKGVLEFVADADSNYYIPFEGGLDYNDDGKLDAADQNVYPGLAIYSETEYEVWKAGTPIFEGPYTNQWGISISGYAPIRDNNGNMVAVLGLDMDVSDIYRLTWKKFQFWQ